MALNIMPYQLTCIKPNISVMNSEHACCRSSLYLLAAEAVEVAKIGATQSKIKIIL